MKPKFSLHRRAGALVLALLLLCNPAAIAQSDDEKIAEEMAKAAAQSAVRELGYEVGKELINMGFQATPPPAGEQTVGGEVIGWAKVGLAVKDFADAKNDKQRLFAGADAAAAGATIACPPVGLIVTAALFVVKLVDMKLSADHAKVMMEIAKRTAEHLRDLYNTYRQEARADAERYLHLFRDIEKTKDEISLLSEEINSYCRPENTSAEDLEACRMRTITIIPKAENFLNLAEDLVKFEGRFISQDQFFAKATKVNRAEFLADLEKQKLDLQKVKKDAQASYAEIAKQTAQRAVRSAIATGNLSPIQTLRNSCFSSTVRQTRLANLALLNYLSSPTDENKAQLAELYAQTQQTFDEGCKELLVGKDDPLVRVMVQRKTALNSLETNLFPR